MKRTSSHTWASTGIQRAWAVLMVAMLAAACTTSSAPGSTSAPYGSTTGTASAEAIPLDGHILLGRDTFYIANADGSDLEELADPSSYCCIARISPDGTRLLTLPGTDDTGPVRGGTLTLDGSEFELLPRPDETLNLVPTTWSPDGTRIAFEGWDPSDPSRTGIYTARVDGNDLVRVTNAPGLPHDSPLDYSPDGTQLVFYRAIRAEPDFPIDLGGSLWVVNVDGSGAHQLDTGDVLPWWQADWSPDGSKILFGTERLQPTGALWTIEPDGSGLTKVFEDPAGRFAVFPVWSPDGSKIMFASNPTNDTFVHNDNEIHAINADGTGLTLVLGGPGYKSISDWWR
jgi:Tol biopolymer transport system component